MISRRSFVAGSLTLAGAGACGPLRSFAQHLGGPGGTVTLVAPTTLPFTLSGNHIFISASVAGKPFAFVFDTGGAAIVTTAIAKALKFETIGQAQVGGAGNDTQTADIVRVPIARIGGVVYSGGAFIAIDPPAGLQSPIPGLAFGGIFGRELFTRLVTTIDYAAATLTFTPPALFRPDPAAAVLPMTLRNGVLPNVSAGVDGHAGAFDVDAGSSAGVTVTAAFAREAGLERDAKRSIDAIIGYGAGGPIEATVLRAATFALGTETFADPVVAIARATGGVFAESGLGGNIGGEVLRRFTVTLDAPGGKLYLKPNARLHDPLAFNRAGMFTKTGPGGEGVVMVVPGSPAARADVRTGDVIVAIAGTGAGHDRTVASWLAPAGTPVTLSIRRGDATLTKSFVLRDLI